MKKKNKAGAITTFIGPNDKIEGAINFEGTIRLDGNMKGKINSQSGTVIVGEQSVIDADLDVDVAIIMGRVNGLIKAKSRVEVYPPASINGDIYAPVVILDAGVSFNGKCEMKKKISTEKKGAGKESKIDFKDLDQSSGKKGQKIFDNIT